jgi:hypothetical protein
MGEATAEPSRVDFDRRIKLEFHGARITSDGGLLAYRELEDAFGLTEIAITKPRTMRIGIDNPTAELRSMIARERLKAARTQGASIGTPFCAASRAASGPRSLAERSRMADHSPSKVGIWGIPD